MSVDPASWQPGTLIVNRDDMLAAQLDERDGDGWHVLVADMEIAIPQFIFDAELADSWQPLADVVARGWERQEVPVRWCPYHECIASDPGEDRCDDAARAHLAPACPLSPALSYPITEGDEP